MSDMTGQGSKAQPGADTASEEAWLTAAITAAFSCIANGKRDFTEFSDYMLALEGERIRPRLAAIYEAYRDLPDANTDGMTSQAGHRRADQRHRHDGRR